MITGWIIYNGQLKSARIEKLVFELVQKAKGLDIDLIAISNDGILPIISNLEEMKNKYNYPEFVIFWDKDINLCRYLENQGLNVYNSSKAINICDDKSYMHLELAKANVNCPKTILGPKTFFNHKLDKEYFDNVVNEISLPFVLKESFSSFGMGVYLIENYNNFCEIIAKIGNNDFIMQKFIEESKGEDIRVNIIGDKIIGAMKRHSDTDFRANMALGSVGEAYKLTKDEEEIALKAHKALGLDFSGVDLLFGKDGPIVCEVNSNVNFLSYEKISKNDVAKEILKYVRSNYNSQDK